MSTDWKPNSDEEHAWREAFERSAPTPERDLVQGALREALPASSLAPQRRRFSPFLLLIPAAAIALLAFLVLPQFLGSKADAVETHPENVLTTPTNSIENAWVFTPHSSATLSAIRAKAPNFRPEARRKNLQKRLQAHRQRINKPLPERRPS